MYRDLRDNNQVFDGMFARFGTALNIGVAGRTERVDGELVSGSYFPTLGVGAALGRTFGEDDDRVPRAHSVAVLSHGYWKSRFNGDSSRLNSTIASTAIHSLSLGFRGRASTASRSAVEPRFLCR